MKQELTLTDTLPQNYLQAKEGLYNRYAGMLLGYIFNIVKNKALAEKHLIDLFASIRPADVATFSEPGVNAFCRLQLLARKALSGFFETNADNSPQPVVNMFTAQMTSDQQKVFLGIYYGGKSTAAIAAELNKSEDDVRKLLKESFSIIRRKPL